MSAPPVPDATGDTARSWHDLMARSAIGDDDLSSAQLAGHDIAVYTVAGAVYATANQCPHGNARLCEGFLLDHEIECPLHQARFDVRSGAVTCGPATVDVPAYPVRVADGRVWVQLPD